MLNTKVFLSINNTNIRNKFIQNNKTAFFHYVKTSQLNECQNSEILGIYPNRSKR